MFNPLALEEDIELPFGLCIVEVESTRCGLSCTGLKSPPTEEVHHQIHVHVQYILDLVKCLMLGPNADVIGVDEFAGLCCWKIINIDVEETWRQDRPLQEFVCLFSPRAVFVCHVYSKTSVMEEELYGLYFPMR